MHSRDVLSELAKFADEEVDPSCIEDMDICLSDFNPSKFIGLRDE